jgi:integrase
MEMGALTDVQLRAWVKAGKPIAGKSDGDGLTFTLSSKGTASWVLRYRMAGKQRELTLGRYPDLSITEARKLAAARRVEVHQVIDVAAIKQRQKAELKQAGTVAELAELWLDHSIRRKHRHPEVTERVIERDILPALGRKATKDVTRPEVTRLLAKIKASGRPTIANDVLRYLRSMFSYGEVLGMVDRNPADGIRLDHAGGKEEARTRALSQKEITKLFKAMREASTSFSRENELGTKLLLALGCRKMELFASQWAEYDLDAGLWRIPGTRTKTGESRELPLPAPVIGWLNELKVRACGSDYAFPARRAGIRFEHVSPDTLNAALHGLEHGLEAFTVHDLRRTSRSLMADIGVEFDVAEKILGHKLPGTAAIYDRGNSLERQRIALERLSALIVELDTGETQTKVVPMSRGRAA